MFIATSVDDHDKEKRTEQNLIVHSRKYEAELVLDVLYYLLLLVCVSLTIISQPRNSVLIRRVQPR